jgi:hypothetical protein
MVSALSHLVATAEIELSCSFLTGGIVPDTPESRLKRV